MKTTIAQKMSISDKKENTGFDLHFDHCPTDLVWTLTERGVISSKVIRIRTEHRSTLSDRCVLESRAIYVLANGLERTDKEVFSTKEDLINSLY